MTIHSHRYSNSQRWRIPRSSKSQILAFLLLIVVLAITAIPTAHAMTEVDLGTTLVALKFDQGVVVGADSRTSVSGYVSNKLAQKIHKITPSAEEKDGTAKEQKEDISCVICRSGSAADTQWLCEEVTHDLWERKYRYQQTSTVQQVAHFLRHLIRSQNGGLKASLICAGCDEEGKIFTIAPSGTLLEEDAFAVSGSGSTFLLGHLDSLNLSAQKYSEEKAIALVTKLLRLSIGRDGSSGGLIRIVIMKKGKKLREITVYPEAPDAEYSPADIPGFAARDSCWGYNRGD